MDILLNVFNFLIAMIALKAMVVGSNFNFYLFLKHGSEYLEWYEQWDNQNFTPKS
jgi:hypothetical protein